MAWVSEPKGLDPVTLGTGDADITAAVPASAKWIVDSILVVNTTNADVSGLRIARVTVSSGDFELLGSGASIVAYDAVPMRLGLILEEGEKIEGHAGTASVIDVHVSVAEVTEET